MLGSRAKIKKSTTKLAMAFFISMQGLQIQLARADEEGLDIFDDIPGVVVPTPKAEPKKPTPAPSRPAAPTGTPGSAGNKRNNPPPSAQIGLVETSSFPEMICPLVDNRPHADILQALNNLSKTVTPVKQCQDQPQAQQLGETLKDLMIAGEKVKGFWEAAQKQTPNAEQLPAFQNQVEIVIKGMNTISELLSNNSFLNSDCGKSLLSGTGILSAVSDLSASIVPIAMTIASINPSWSLPTNVILGLTGVGTVSNVLQSMRSSQSIDMSEPQNRLALLQNTCEFLKIATRVRFIALAQSGQIEAVNKELMNLRTRRQAHLMTLQSDGIRRMLQIRDDLMSGILRVERTLKSDSYELTGSLEIAETSQRAMCQFGRQMSSRISDASKLPIRSVRNFESLLKGQSSLAPSQTLMLAVESNAREEMVNNTKSTNVTLCAESTKAYVEALKKMIQLTQKTVSTHKQSLQSQLSRDPEYRQYAKLEFNSNAEIKTWEQVANILQKVNSDNGAIDRTEMDLQLKNLRRALFEGKTTWVFWSNESPVSQWLGFINNLLTQSVQSFGREYKVLVDLAGQLTLTKVDPVVLTTTVDPYTGTAIYSPLADQYIKDLQAAENLSPLRPEVVIVGEPQHEMICKTLENTWIEYVTALNNLSAQSAFCTAVRPLFDHATERSIVDHCRGELRADGKTLRPSLIQRRATEISKTLKARAERVTAKMRELSCPMPDALKTLPYSSRM